jgi:hypothetical protein
LERQGANLPTEVAGGEMGVLWLEGNHPHMFSCAIADSYPEQSTTLSPQHDFSFSE